ncbi:cobyric acid synthase [Rhodalgimonas zhirmunskyi]|uniref:Cobyric acid synthase n=1 Tax=Rhodalgimonas zhirmunskyi TaxID=2964767 RepID=A0AAJ1UDL7_9RHOB|nr:cobyric acid synthase [Rhodoalgimonas zhirmunskyi]MDQ2095583.1 cobyric acid synthase [Rhodoalgimonas zhirmunskyi]
MAPDVRSAMRKTPAIMIQGTGSNVGKSTLVAGIARALANRGLSVAPFKPQNMSNNAAVTVDGGEIGRAQALQAMAARRDPVSDMNPVLLKPESDTGAQVIVQGQFAGHLKARNFTRDRQSLLTPVMESFERLSQNADITVVEGAGSPAEVNLRQGDIANMGFAVASQTPVILVGDIDRGGVIAQIVGTKAVLSREDNALIRGFALNKFRGDLRLFDDGLRAIEQHTDWPSLGVLPWFGAAWRLPAEDALDLRAAPRDGGLTIAVPRLPHISNFDDLDPLAAEPGVNLVIVDPGQPLPADATLILLPGSKSTLADLAFMRAEGWDIDLSAHLRRGGHALGLCGGYQMLGRKVADPEGVEGPATHAPGLGHLDVETVLGPSKTLALRNAYHSASGAALSGYEIHLGRTQGPDCARAWLTVEGAPEGAASANGHVMGCYLHGIFRSDAFRKAFLAGLGVQSALAYDDTVDATLDRLAAHVEAYFDLDKLLEISAR